MGLKPRLLTQLIESGMEHGSLLHDSLMVLKGDQPVQPNGSPLLLSSNNLKNESFANNTTTKPIVNNGCSIQRTLPSLPPLKVDVNGFKQSPLVSPMEPSSLTSSALPTPLLDLESNSNCSDSAVPHGDLYPSNFVAGGVSFRTHAVSGDLRSPGTSAFVQHQPQYQPSTGFFPQVPKLPVKNPPTNLKRANDNALRKAFTEKVSKRKEELRFIMPKSAEANATQLSTMLKKARRQTDLPKAIDAALFEEGGRVPSPKAHTEKQKKPPAVVDEYATDYSDCEDTPDLISVPYNKIRECEERVRFAADDARIAFAIVEKKQRLAQLERALANMSSSEDPTVFPLPVRPEDVCARMRPYTRAYNRKLLRLGQGVDYSRMQPSTSSCAALRPTVQKAVPSVEEEMVDALHWMAMNPSFTSRRSINQSVHLINDKDLAEEAWRNGTSRRVERDKKKMRTEAKGPAPVHRAVDFYDSYEDTEPEDDEYVPPYESPGKKSKPVRGTGRGRGRPTREQQKEREQQASKLGRRHSTANSKQPSTYEFDPYSSEMGVASLPDTVKYSEIEVPAFSLVKDESLLVGTDTCTHSFGDLISEQIHHHRIMEAEERTRFKQVGRKKAVVVEREPSVEEELESGWSAPSPAAPSSVQTTI